MFKRMVRRVMDKVFASKKIKRLIDIFDALMSYLP
jgi:hypothetical protein